MSVPFGFYVLVPEFVRAMCLVIPTYSVIRLTGGWENTKKKKKRKGRSENERERGRGRGRKKDRYEDGSYPLA